MTQEGTIQSSQRVRGGLRQLVADFPREGLRTARASQAAASWGCDVTSLSRRPGYQRLSLPPSWPALLPAPRACPRLLSHDPGDTAGQLLLKEQLPSASWGSRGPPPFPRAPAPWEGPERVTLCLVVFKLGSSKPWECLRAL